MINNYLISIENFYLVKKQKGENFVEKIRRFKNREKMWWAWPNWAAKVPKSNRRPLDKSFLACLCKITSMKNSSVDCSSFESFWLDVDANLALKMIFRENYYYSLDCVYLDLFGLCWLSSIRFKWRILSRTSTEQSGKNEKKNLPTGLQVHLEDMFWV